MRVPNGPFMSTRPRLAPVRRIDFAFLPIDPPPLAAIGAVSAFAIANWFRGDARLGTSSAKKPPDPHNIFY
jgi:hypothetical protein